MGEIVEVQAETELAIVGAEAHDIAKGVEILRLAVRSETHHFVFVAEFQEAEILGHGAVVEAEGVGKCDGAINVHAVAAAGAPHGTGEITEAVGGKQRGMLKRRNEVSAGEMGLVVLDAMKGGFYFRGVTFKGPRERRGNAREFRDDPDALAGKGRHPQGIEELGGEPRVGISRDGHMIEIRKR